MTHAPAAATSAATSARTSRAGDIALIAVFAALLAALAMTPPIPVGPVGVPITLQTFGVALCGLVLGPWRGGGAALLYVVLGLIGLPIFSGMRGGIGILAGPSAGYIIGFTLYAFACGVVAVWALRRFRGTKLAVWLIVGSIASSLIFSHIPGILGMSLNADLPLSAAFAADLIYVPGDIIKNVLAVVVALTVHRAFPNVLRRRGVAAIAPATPAAPTASEES